VMTKRKSAESLVTFVTSPVTTKKATIAKQLCLTRV